MAANAILISLTNNKALQFHPCKSPAVCAILKVFTPVGQGGSGSDGISMRIVTQWKVFQTVVLRQLEIYL